MKRRVLGGGVVLWVACLCWPMPALASISTKPILGWGTNGRVDAVVVLGDTTYVGGSFTELVNGSGASIPVANLAAFDATGSPVTTFRPSFNGAVKALTTNGADLYAGGSFTAVNGERWLHLVKLAPSGDAVSFEGHTNREVDSLLTLNGSIYAGGTFTRASGTQRNSAAAFDAATGHLQLWNPDADARVDALAATPSAVIVGGFFHALNGATAPRLAATDPATGATLPWASHPNYPVLALTSTSGGVFAGLGGPGGYVTGYSTAGNLVWTQRVDGNVQAITVAGGEIVAGGHFNHLCDAGSGCLNPIPRRKLAAFTATGSLDTAWHPPANSRLGVYALFATATQLIAGGDFTKIAGVFVSHLARFAIA